MLDSISTASSSTATRPQVVIVGAGFGGLSAAKSLANAAVEVVVIDRQNYHLFQPLLYQVATAGLSPAEIAAPIRGMIGMYHNVTVMFGSVQSVDVAARKVLIEGGRDVPYDYLILATGAHHAYFGHDNWEPFAPGLKRIEDATKIRRRILLAFEEAENETDPDERRRLMNIAIVGGGPTGVELAGAIAELARRALAKDFRNIDPRDTRIILIEAGPSLLSTMPADLSNDAQRRLEKLGVEVHLNAPVTAVDAAGVTMGTARIEARTVIWAAGVAASPAGEWIGAECDHVGRIKVNADLSLPGHPEIFAIGDTALAIDAAGKQLPGVAPVAKQQGVYLGNLIKARLRDGEVLPFHYRNYGNLATIGRKAAVIDFGWIHLRGFVAWVIWSVAHIFFLIGFRNRIMVALNWLWAYFTFQRGARLITGSDFDSTICAHKGRSESREDVAAA
ncbi:MAG TPA: NAD(P)/FAD-dependent oxidoreductase [Xanthobacteraceae bacterium]|jgi:NADH dehydrogenase